MVPMIVAVKEGWGCSVKESLVLGQLKHPNITELLNILREGLNTILILELAENGDLFDYNHNRKDLTEPEACYLFRQISAAMYDCHSLKIILRGLKSENIPQYRDMIAKIVDYGRAHNLADGNPCTRSRNSQIHGSRGSYMSWGTL